LDIVGERGDYTNGENTMELEMAAQRRIRDIKCSWQGFAALPVRFIVGYPSANIAGNSILGRF